MLTMERYSKERWQFFHGSGKPNGRQHSMTNRGWKQSSPSSKFIFPNKEQNNPYQENPYRHSFTPKRHITLAEAHYRSHRYRRQPHSRTTNRQKGRFFSTERIDQARDHSRQNTSDKRKARNFGNS